MNLRVISSSRRHLSFCKFSLTTNQMNYYLPSQSMVLWRFLGIHMSIFHYFLIRLQIFFLKFTLNNKSWKQKTEWSSRSV
jgi:hypothetical protein